METKWLEDFISLAETHSFSRSAELRHITQPAFSRRIRSLEAWLGADLIDRTAYPTSLTAAGELFYAEAVGMLAHLHDSRALLHGDRRTAQNTINFAMPHTLSLTFMPKWIAALQADVGRVFSRLIAANVHDAMMSLTEGGCDLLLCYHHPRHPLQLDLARFEALVLGVESLHPYARCDKAGRPLLVLPGSVQAPLPFLGYTATAYLGRMVALLLAGHAAGPWLEKIYETDMAEGLKMMALEGHGLAFLPKSAVAREVRQKLLARADGGSDAWSLAMEIRLYRERPTTERPGKPVVARLWDHLLAQASHQRPRRPCRRSILTRVPPSSVI